MSDLLRIEQLVKTYEKGRSTIEVLQGLDLSLENRECVAIMGASGVGKSTLLHLLGALDRPNAGKIIYKENDVNELSKTELARFRNQAVGFIFQFHYLLPEFTAVENVCLPLMMRRMSKEESREKAKEWLKRVGLGERYEHKPSELSGGEQQRVAIARALIGEPDLILADEPTGDLDVATAEIVSELLLDITKNEGKALIIATHNPEIAAKADRILRMKQGRLEPASDV